MEQGGKLSEAKTHYEKVLDTDSENVEAIVGLARMQQQLGNVQEAERGYHRAIKLDPDSAVALQGLGHLFSGRDDWDRAATVLEKAVLVAPDDKAIRYELAVALVHTGQIDSALPHFIRTVGDAEAHYNVGLILHQNGELADSEKQFRLALSKKPELDSARYWLETVVRGAERRRGAHANSAGAAAAEPLQPSALSPTPTMQVAASSARPPFNRTRKRPSPPPERPESPTATTLSPNDGAAAGRDSR
ncbi:MAG: tetratricopeptide repeat protein [Planctomycetaceae bacterium]